VRVRVFVFVFVIMAVVDLIASFLLLLLLLLHDLNQLSVFVEDSPARSSFSFTFAHKSQWVRDCSANTRQYLGRRVHAKNNLIHP
jgi:hypothetical protein